MMFSQQLHLEGGVTELRPEEQLTPYEERLVELTWNKVSRLIDWLCDTTDEQRSVQKLILNGRRTIIFRAELNLTRVFVAIFDVATRTLYPCDKFYPRTSEALEQAKRKYKLHHPISSQANAAPCEDVKWDGLVKEFVLVA